MANGKSSAISGFYKLSREKKIDAVKEFSGISEEQAKLLLSANPLSPSAAEKTSENVISVHSIPLSVATNFIINGKEMLVPMAIEEPSVVAAASFAAKLCRDTGGFSANADPPVMIGQIQIVGAKDLAPGATDSFRRTSGPLAGSPASRRDSGTAVPLDAASVAAKLNAAKNEILAAAEPFAANITSYGGGLRGFAAKAIETARGGMAIAEFHVDVRDSMGANTVNTILEGAAPKIQEMAGGKVRLRIISNLAVLRLARATAIWKAETIGADAVEGILDAWAFADADIYRCATHNKGIMNGIDAVCIATGNDWRAVEAGAHSYAAVSGAYRSLTRYRKLPNGDLQGEIELPMAVATIGGATRSLPSAGVALAILGVKSAGELACVIASVGLAQNFAAIRALSTEGIQRGHMELHAKNIAIAAGAAGAEIEHVASQMAAEKNINTKRAEEILKEIRK